MEEFAKFIMASRWRAIGLAALFALVGIYFIPVTIVSAAVVGLVALRRGNGEGGIIALAAGGVTWGVFSVLTAKPGFPFPLAYALWIPVLFSAAVLRQTRSQGHALMATGVFMIMYVLAMHLIVGDVTDFWKNWLTQAVANVKGATVYGFEREGTLRLMNGLVTMLYTASVMLALLLARWWQAILYNPGGFAMEFRQLRLPRWLLVAVVASIWGTGFWNKPLMVDFLLLAMVVYLFQGLAVIHFLVARQGLSWVWLIPVYGLLMFAPHYAIIGGALLGAADSIVDMRKSLRKGQKE